MTNKRGNVTWEVGRTCIFSLLHRALSQAGLLFVTLYSSDKTNLNSLAYENK